MRRISYACSGILDRGFIGTVVLAIMTLGVTLASSSVAQAEETSDSRIRRPVFPTLRAQRTLPEPYAEVLINGQPHFLAQGNFYQEIRRGSSTLYAPVRPDYGAKMEGMPTEWRVLMIHGRTYYRNGPNFFKRIDCDGEAVFELAKPPIGAEIDGMPPGHRLVKGEAIYYAADGVYYQPVRTSEGLRFEVVGSPG